MPTIFLLLFLLAAAVSRAGSPDATALQISQLSNQTVEISWSELADRGILETSDALGVAANWKPVAETPVLVNGRRQVQVTAGAAQRFFRVRLATGPLTTVRETSPAAGETGVAITRETIFRLTAPLATGAVLKPEAVFARFGGRRVLSRAELGTDRRTVTLFYLENLPASAHVQVNFDGQGLLDEGGEWIDADGDGQPGGVRTLDFVTFGNTPVEGTGVIGRVYASEKNADGSDHPLSGVTITVDGAEQSLRALTDANGFFRLQPAPSGKFFVHIDGRTASGSQWPSGAYYPVVGKAWETRPGDTNNPAGGTGEIFLPLIPADALQPVSPTVDTTIGFSPSVIATNPLFAQVTITVPANSLYSDNGQRGGKVGIAPVPPDRLPGPLPPGLEFSLVITVQTDGGLNFDRPAPICFPNLNDPVLGKPLPAGSKQALISFNHDKGEWEAVGTMTVSADGKLICSDPGSGIRQPGWHGAGPGGSGPPPPPPGGGGCGGKGERPCGCKPDSKKLSACLQQCEEQLKECEKIAAIIYAADVKSCKANFAAGLIDAFSFQLCLENSSKQWEARKKECVRDSRRCQDGCIDCWGTPLPAGRAHPQLASPSPDPAEAVFARFDELVNYLSASPFPDSSAAATEIEKALNELDTLAGGDFETFMIEQILEDLRDPSVTADLAYPDDGIAPVRPVHFAAEIQRPSGELIIRGMTTLWNGAPESGFGSYTVFIPRDGRLTAVRFYDPVDKSFGLTLPDYRPEAPYLLSRLILSPLAADAEDADADGLPDQGERVLGTDPAKADSDGDGLRDGAEIENGSDPLDGFPMQQGVVASVETLGAAVDVCVVDQVAIVAEGSAGVSVFDAKDVFNPVRVAQVDTPGDARSVACAGNLVAVADGPEGLAVIDISDRSKSFLARQTPLAGNAVAVSVRGGIAYVGLEAGVVVAVDLATGRELNRLSLGLTGLHDVLAMGDALYALVPPRLFTLSFDGGELAITSDFPTVPPGPVLRERLNAGNGRLYSAAYLGFQVFDLKDPLKPALLHTHETPQVGWRQIVPNGSGLGVGVASINGKAESTDVYLHDLNPGGSNSVFVTFLPTPGIASSLAIFNGLGYLADGPRGLQIVNYLPPDTRGVPPTIELGASFPLTPVARAESDSNVQLSATVGDDVQVRSVEFYVDGTLIGTDGSFPFAANFLTPTRSGASTSFGVRAKAIDTGGNSTWTPELTVALVADATRPRVRRMTREGSGDLVDRVTVLFSEPIQLATFNASTVQILSAGADRLLDTADDTVIPASSYSVNATALTAEIGFATSLPNGGYRITLTTGVMDLNNNALDSPVTHEFRVPDALLWNGRVSSDYGDPHNWSPERVPGPTDRAFLGFGKVQIQNPTTVRGLESFAEIGLHQVTLEAKEGMVLHRDLTLNGATVRKSSLTLADGAVVQINNQAGNVLEDVAIRGDVDLGQEGQLRIRNSITMQGALRGANRAFVSVEGVTRFGGGSLEFKGGTIHLQEGAEFTLAPDGVLKGAGQVTGPGVFINQGSLRADGSAGPGLTIAPQQFTHLGTAESLGGGVMTFGGKWSGEGRIEVIEGRVQLGGEFGLPLPRITKTTNGLVVIASVVDLKGGAVTLDETTGGWRLAGGGFRNGALHLLEGVALSTGESVNNLLENMVIDGLVNVSAGGSIAVRNGLTLKGTWVQDFSSLTRFEGEQVFAGGTLELRQGGLVLPEGAKLTLVEGVVLRGSGGVSGNGALVNRGRILADSDRGLTIAPGGLIHQGTMEIIGDASLVLGGALSGSGVIDVTQGRLFLNGQFTGALPNVRKASAGTVYLQSNIDLAGGSVVLNATTGGWNILNGGFRNGTIQLLEGVALIFEPSLGNLLENVVVNGALNLWQPFNPGLLRVRGGLTLNGAITLAGNAAVTFEGDQEFPSGTIQFGEGGRLVVPAESKLTLGSAALVRGQNGSLEGAGALLNRGKISADVGGGTLRITVENFTNQGVLEAINGGTLVAPGYP